MGGNNALCTGTIVALRCTLTGDTLIWYTPEALSFERGGPSESNAGSYQGQLEELNATHLRSTLTFTFTFQITINCSDSSSSKSTTLFIEGIGIVYNNIITHEVSMIYELHNAGPPSAPDRPLTDLDRIRRLNKTFSSVTVVWNIPDTNNTHISSYVVTVDPPIPLPASGVIAADNPLFQSRQLTLTLLHGQQYYITVRAKSCDDSVEGVVSEALGIKVQG